MIVYRTLGVGHSRSTRIKSGLQGIQCLRIGFIFSGLGRSRRRRDPSKKVTSVAHYYYHCKDFCCYYSYSYSYHSTYSYYSYYSSYCSYYYHETRASASRSLRICEGKVRQQLQPRLRACVEDDCEILWLRMANLSYKTMWKFHRIKDPYIELD